MKLFIAPHNDDETLFGAFTILREQPLVVIVTDSVRQVRRGITAEQRRAETSAAMDVLGVAAMFLGLPDNELTVEKVAQALTPLIAEAEHIYLPAYEVNGNEDHNLIARMAMPFPNVTRYVTYTKAGKSVGRPVPTQASWITLKLKALACYDSQIKETSTREHFMRGLHEYYV